MDAIVLVFVVVFCSVRIRRKCLDCCDRRHELPNRVTPMVRPIGSLPNDIPLIVEGNGNDSGVCSDIFRVSLLKSNRLHCDPKPDDAIVAILAQSLVVKSSRFKLVISLATLGVYSFATRQLL